MATYIQIGSTVTVGSGGQAAIEFTAIPSTYTDLLLNFSTRCSQNGTFGIRVAFNTSAANFTGIYIQGAGSGTPASASAPQLVGVSPGSAITANTFNSGSLYIPNYASSNNKSFSADDALENNATTAYITLNAGLWSQTAAINAIKLTPDSASTFVQYSTATLYGISKS
jgi:hypothetical protein